MEPGSSENQVPEEYREPLPEETKKALKFVNDFVSSLDQEERVLLHKDEQAALLSFMLGIKPSVLINHDLKKPEAIQEYLDQSGKDAFIYQKNMIVNRELVQQRISEETDFAKELGWQEGMSIEDWLEQADPKGTGEQRAIIGFFLGFPKSAVEAYANKQIQNGISVNIEGPHGGRALYFTTDKSLAEADDVKALREKYKMAFQKAGMQRFMKK